MIRTSIGHHTFTLSKRILNEEINQMGYIYRNGKQKNLRSTPAKKLRKDIIDFMIRTGEIDIYVPIPKSYEWRPAKREIDSNGRLLIENNSTWKIVYLSDEHQGLSWILRYNNHSMRFSEYIIEARINPKVFVGIKDYIRASDGSYLIEVEKKFNDEANRISPLLGQFYQYKPKRIDFCINFDLRELGITCTPEQMRWLIKRGDYPSHFEEYQYYDKISHRKRTFKNFYLKSGSVNINCYYKYHQLKNQFPDCPNIEDAQHIIRFEVQCKYRKTYMMMVSECKRMEMEKESLLKSYMQVRDETDIETIMNNFSVDNPVRIIHRMLSDITAEKIIEKYFNQIIKQGDYYTLEEAKRMIEDENINPQGEGYILQTLNEINRIGIAKFREQLNPEGMKIFRKVLDKLAKLKVNPVTIPKSFKIKHIPNLLDSFKRLRDSSGLSDSSCIDPYESLEQPYELLTSQGDVENLLENLYCKGEMSNFLLLYSDSHSFVADLKRFAKERGIAAHVPTVTQKQGTALSRLNLSPFPYRNTRRWHRTIIA